MAFQPVPNCADAAMVFRYDGAVDDYIVTSSWLRLGDWGEEELQALVDEMQVQFIAELDDFVPATAQLVECRARDLEVEFGASATNTDAAAGVVASTAYLPPNCAVPILLRCGGVGPPKRGYNFWPFVLESECDRVGTLSGSALNVPNSMRLWSEAIEGALAGVTRVVISRYFTAGNPPTSQLREIGIPNPVTSYSLGRDGFVASQRDRRPGVGS